MKGLQTAKNESKSVETNFDYKWFIKHVTAAAA